MQNIIELQTYEILYSKEEDAFLFSFEIEDTQLNPEIFPKKVTSFTFNNERKTFEILFQEDSYTDVLLKLQPLSNRFLSSESYNQFESFINNPEKKVFILGLHSSVSVENHHIYFADSVSIISPIIKKSYTI